MYFLNLSSVSETRIRLNQMKFSIDQNGRISKKMHMIHQNNFFSLYHKAGVGRKKFHSSEPSTKTL